MEDFCASGNCESIDWKTSLLGSTKFSASELTDFYPPVLVPDFLSEVDISFEVLVGTFEYLELFVRLVWDSRN